MNFSRSAQTFAEHSPYADARSSSLDWGSPLVLVIVALLIPVVLGLATYRIVDLATRMAPVVPPTTQYAPNSR